MQHIKIMFYINVLTKGGAERVMLSLAQQFQAKGYEVLLVTSYRDFDEYEIPDNIRVCALEKAQIVQSRIRRNLTRIRKFRRLCWQEKPDVLISFLQEPNFRSICATIGLPVKNIISVRNDPNVEYAGKVGRFVGKWILPMADGCVFQTKEAMQWFPRRLQRKSTIIPNAVADVFYETPRKPRPNDIVTVGRLSAQKNQMLLIEAFGDIEDRFPETNLRIYGAGVLEDALWEKINQRDLTGRVFLMGTTDHVEEVLAGAKVFVLPSDYEGMPNALMEAMAMGVPSIATDCPCGGPGMLIRDKENGFLFPVGDRRALAELLAELLSDEEKRKHVGEAARVRAKEFYPQKVFAIWEDYITKIVGG
jgi:glycosyltransferase involved in cell wall biosynthesis